MYRKTSVAAVVVAFVMTAHLAFSYSQDREPERKGVLSVLRVGQSVILKEIGDRYEVSFLEREVGVLGHKVVAVGQDWIVVQDLVGAIETRIPIWSIRAVTVIKTRSDAR